MGSQRALGRRRRTMAELDEILVGTVDRLSRRLREAKRVCRTVVLRMRFADFGRATRSRTLVEATDHTETILAAARRLLYESQSLVYDRGLTLIGLSLSNLDGDGSVQLVLPFDVADGDALDTTLDVVRNRFGAGAVTRAALLGAEAGMEVPLLPE
jgi:DNA polymerase-4